MSGGRPLEVMSARHGRLHVRDSIQPNGPRSWQFGRALRIRILHVDLGPDRGLDGGRAQRGSAVHDHARDLREAAARARPVSACDSGGDVARDGLENPQFDRNSTRRAPWVILSISASSVRLAGDGVGPAARLTLARPAYARPESTRAPARLRQSASAVSDRRAAAGNGIHRKGPAIYRLVIAGLNEAT